MNKLDRASDLVVGARSGMTYELLAAEYGISRQRVYQILIEELGTEGLRKVRAEGREYLRWSRKEEINSCKEEILRRFVAGEDLELICKDLNLGVTLAKELVSKWLTAEQRAQRSHNLASKRGSRDEFSDEELLHYLRWAVDVYDVKGATSYNRVAKMYGLPSHQALAIRFGSWMGALEKIGVRPTQAQTTISKVKLESRVWTEDAILDAMYYLYEQEGILPPAHEYQKISPTIPWIPSNHLVRVRLRARGLGLWATLRVHIMDTYPSWVPKHTKEELALIGEKASMHGGRPRKEVMQNN
jgi:hypothetical protein